MFRHLIRGYSKSLVAAAAARTGATAGAGASGSTAAAAATRSPLTIYHNPASPLSSQLLAKLAKYSSLPCTSARYSDTHANAIAVDPPKFSYTLKTNQSLTFADYEFIVNECADIHPHNTHVVRRLLNTHKHAPLCVSDFHKLSHTEFPVIIDYDHKLVANDEVSFDRILQHYLSCGIQHSSDSTSVHTSRAQAQARPQPFHHNSLVHPHVAEFADLF